MMADAFADSLEACDVVDPVVGWSGVRRIAPRLSPAVAQPEDAGLRIGREVDVGLEVLGFAAIEGGALDLALEADGAGIEAVRDLRIGDQAAALHGRFEVGLAGDPVVDGAPRDAEELAELLVGRAEQAVLVRLLAEVGLVGRGASVGVHARNITEV